MFSRNIPQRDRTQYVRSALAPLSAVNGPVLPAMLPLSHVGAGSLTALDFEDRPLAILSSSFVCHSFATKNMIVLYRQPTHREMFL